MEHVDTLLKTTLAEIERVLTTKTVVGEPLELAGNTIVPLVAVGFGFGGGGGAGEDPKASAAKGEGAGTGGGGGIKPVAVIIIDKDGHARVEPIRAAASVVEKIGEAVARVVETHEGRDRAPRPSAAS
ncbi:MAG: spore germination protein GerW family protein [Vicinamibacterales bacterium]